jgi:hypothetical protein
MFLWAMLMLPVRPHLSWLCLLEWALLGGTLPTVVEGGSDA